MPTYVSLMKWTDQGIKAIKDAPQRWQEQIKSLQSMGAQIKGIYACMGEYDMVAIADFPNDEAAMCFLLAMSSQGNVRATALKAFNPEEFGKVCKMLP